MNATRKIFRIALMQFFNYCFDGKHFTLPLREIFRLAREGGELSRLEEHYAQGVIEYAKKEKYIDGAYFGSGRHPDAPRLRHCTVIKQHLFDGRKAEVTGHALSAMKEPSWRLVSRAFGEYLERRAASYPTEKVERLMKKGTALEFEASYGESRVYPYWKYNGYLPFQEKAHKKLNHSKDKTLTWLLGKNEVSKKRIFIPAQALFYSYGRWQTKKGEPQIMDPTSNGAAGFFSYEGAFNRALYEYVERDAFIVHWLTRTSPRLIELSTITDPTILEMIAYVRRYNIEPYILDITPETRIPSFCVVLVDRGIGGPKLVLSAAAGMDVKKVVLSALREATTMSRTFAEKPGIFPSDYRPFVDSHIGIHERVALWMDTSLFEKASFLWGGEEISFEEVLSLNKSFSNEKEEYEYLVSLFGDLGEGYEPMAYEYETPELDAFGFHAVRVLIPKLYPMYLTESAAFLDSARLREWYAAKTGKTLRFEDINPYPHPFP